MANFTKLLLHLDGSDGSTTFTDSSIYAATVTPSGNAQIDTAQSVFGGASGLFDDNGDYLTIGAASRYSPATGDFTIDFRVRMAADGGNEAIMSMNASNNFDVFINAISNILDIYLGTSRYTFSWNPAADTWYHVAVTRSGTDLRAFIDGTQIGITQSSSDDISVATDDMLISKDTGSATYHNGWIDEFRLSIGVARWTGNFTPPSAAYDNPSSTSSSSSSCRSSSSSSRSSSSSSRSSSSSSSSCRSSSSSSSSKSSSSSCSSSSSSSSKSSSSSSSSCRSSSSSSRSSSSSSSSSSCRSSSSSSCSSSSSSCRSSSSSSSSSSSFSSSSSCRSSSSSCSSMSHIVYKVDGIDKLSKTITYAIGNNDDYVKDVDTDLISLFQEINRGFKPTRVTTAQRNAITDLYAGLIVLNVSTNKLNFYTGTAWEAITSA